MSEPALLCASCDASVSPDELSQGLAVRIDGRIICQNCVDTLPGEAQFQINQMRGLRGLASTTYSVRLPRHPAMQLFSFTSAALINQHRRTLAAGGDFTVLPLPPPGQRVKIRRPVQPVRMSSSQKAVAFAVVGGASLVAVGGLLLLIGSGPRAASPAMPVPQVAAVSIKPPAILAVPAPGGNDLIATAMTEGLTSARIARLTEIEDAIAKGSLHAAGQKLDDLHRLSGPAFKQVNEWEQVLRQRLIAARDQPPPPEAPEPVPEEVATPGKTAVQLPSLPQGGEQLLIKDLTITAEGGQAKLSVQTPVVPVVPDIPVAVAPAPPAPVAPVPAPVEAAPVAPQVVEPQTAKPATSIEDLEFLSLGAKENQVAEDSTQLLPTPFPVDSSGFLRSIAGKRNPKVHVLSVQFKRIEPDTTGLVLLLHPGRSDRKEVSIHVGQEKPVKIALEYGWKRVVLPLPPNPSAFLLTLKDTSEVAADRGFLLARIEAVRGRPTTDADTRPPEFSLLGGDWSTADGKAQMKALDLSLAKVLNARKLKANDKKIDPSKVKILVNDMSQQFQAALRKELKLWWDKDPANHNPTEMGFEGSTLTEAQFGKGDPIANPDEYLLVALVTNASELKSPQLSDAKDLLNHLLKLASALTTGSSKTEEQRNAVIPAVIIGATRETLSDAEVRALDALWGQVIPGLLKQGVPVIDLRKAQAAAATKDQRAALTARYLTAGLRSLAYQLRLLASAR